MPILPCPQGARCTDGEDGATWKSVDIAFEQAQVLVADHVREAHHQGAVNDGVLNLNENKGAQGGNFMNSKLENNTFNVHTSVPAAVPAPVPAPVSPSGITQRILIRISP